ncbi:MAG TPA: tRNA lysidine(34) synthetase TilS [Firmicutes bacterium]|nr:tRNA lysidine(34) synthetase TilS [Bacillota bacterium]
MSNDLLPQFERSLDHLALGTEEHVLIAVSGGPDSMALLHLFARWDKNRIGVFHLNHRFRPEAEAEARFVADYAAGLGIPAHITSYDINRYLEQSGESKQQGARRIRYRLLRTCAEKEGYGCIALGHHGDDQAETVLMRLLRGSGLQGLGGIPPRRGPFIRPLLAVCKTDIIKYCQTFKVPYVEDASNWEPVYVRNKIRHELLPLLAREYNPEITKQLMQLAALARQDDLELQRQAGAICRQHSVWDWGQLRLKRAVFTDLSPAMQRRVLRTLLANYRGHLRRIGFKHIEIWRRKLLADSAFRLSLPDVSVSATADFIFVGEFKGRAWQPQVLAVPGEVAAGPFTIRAELFTAAELPGRAPFSEDFDWEGLARPLVVRPRRDGDRLHPFGAQGTKKVKDLLIEARIPAERRDFIPLVCDRQDILWIPTVRRGRSAPLTGQTGRVLRLSLTCN